MKKTVLFAAAAAVLAAGIAVAADLPTIGCAIYKFDDTFMTGVRNAILKTAEGKAKVDMVDSQNAQATQNDKVDLFITKKVKALAINPVDRAAAGVIVQKAKAAGIPVVFFNREPFKDDMAKYDKAYYVGAIAEQSGTMEGKLAVDYWKANPTADLNKDGVMQYVMLKGEPGHQDAELRTKFSIKAVEDAGIKVQKVAEDTGMWDRVKGQEKMAAFLAAHKDIEIVFANNDDMALGAIEALKAAGYFKGGKFMPVVGVDATAPGAPGPQGRHAPRHRAERRQEPGRRDRQPGDGAGQGRGARPRPTSATRSRTASTSGSTTSRSPRPTWPRRSSAGPVSS